VIRVGILGLSEGNGHPFSFSAIINGYSEPDLAAAGWPVIHEYVRRHHSVDFGVQELRVTHAWTQDPAVTRALCAACRIEHAVETPEEMLGRVDAVILARDDHERHRAIAEPFLSAGLPVLVDKPLTLDRDDLAFFRPYLERGRLMSCSAMRFATELDAARTEQGEYGEIRLVRGAVLNDWARYGVHMVDAIQPLLTGQVVSVSAHRAAHESMAIETDDGGLALIDALGAVPKTFRVDIFGTRRTSSHDVTDNFGMFRRLLWQFAEMIRTGAPAIPVEDTLEVLRILMAGKRSRESGTRVRLSEF
jgi:predicted dehydrogenase